MCIIHIMRIAGRNCIPGGKSIEGTGGIGYEENTVNESLIMWLTKIYAMVLIFTVTGKAIGWLTAPWYSALTPLWLWLGLMLGLCIYAVIGGISDELWQRKMRKRMPAMAREIRKKESL